METNETKPRDLVLLEDAPEGKRGMVLKAVEAHRADELMSQSKARVAPEAEMMAADTGMWKPRSLVLLEDAPEGKRDAFVEGVEATRADELLAQNKARLATEADKTKPADTGARKTGYADTPPMSLVLLEDVAEGKKGAVVKAVEAGRADELMSQNKARPATKADFAFAGQ